MVAPRYTFDPSKDADFDDLAPMLGTALHGGLPIVSLGAIPLATAQAWLVAQHKRYAEAIGKRSQLMQKMQILDRIELVDTTP